MLMKEDSRATLADEPLVDRLCRPVCGKRVTPPSAIADHKDYAPDDLPIINSQSLRESGKYGPIRCICDPDFQIKSFMITPPGPQLDQPIIHYTLNQRVLSVTTRVFKRGEPSIIIIGGGLKGSSNSMLELCQQVSMSRGISTRAGLPKVKSP